MIAIDFAKKFLVWFVFFNLFLNSVLAFDFWSWIKKFFGEQEYVVYEYNCRVDTDCCALASPGQYVDCRGRQASSDRIVYDCYYRSSYVDGYTQCGSVPRTKTATTTKSQISQTTTKTATTTVSVCKTYDMKCSDDLRKILYCENNVWKVARECDASSECRKTDLGGGQYSFGCVAKPSARKCSITNDDLTRSQNVFKTTIPKDVVGAYEHLKGFSFCNWENGDLYEFVCKDGSWEIKIEDDYCVRNCFADGTEVDEKNVGACCSGKYIILNIKEKGILEWFEKKYFCGNDIEKLPSYIRETVENANVYWDRDTGEVYKDNRLIGKADNIAELAGIAVGEGISVPIKTVSKVSSTILEESGENIGKTMTSFFDGLAKSFGLPEGAGKWILIVLVVLIVIAILK